jgi:outer membrane protein
VNRKIFFAAFCVLCAGTASAESLYDVYSLALKNDYRIKAAESAYLAGQEAANVAKARLLPNINAEGTLGKARRISKAESSNPFAVNIENVIDNDSPGYSVTLTQPLINFPGRHDTRRGEIAARLATLEWERARQSLIMRTADVYLQTLTAGAKLEAAESAENAFRLRLRAATMRYDAGSARGTDVLEAQAALDAASADTIVAKNNLNVLFDSLKGISGQDHDGLSALPDDFTANPPVPADMKQWVDSAIQNNLEIGIAKLRADDAYQNAKGRAKEHWPRLSGRLSYTDNYERRTYSAAVPDTVYQSGLSAMLVLSVPIYSGGGMSAAAREAKHRSAQETENSHGTSRDIVQRAHSSYMSMIAGVAALNARKAAIVSALRSLEFAQKGYGEGIMSMINVLDAQRAVYEARQNYADALYSYLIAGLRLKETAGVLSARDIEELSRRLDSTKKVTRPGFN